MAVSEGSAPEASSEAQDPVARFEGTGESERLEEALTALDELPLEEHGPAYERLHAELRRLLDREPSEVPEGLLRGVREPVGEEPAADPASGAGPAPDAVPAAETAPPSRSEGPSAGGTSSPPEAGRP